MYDKQVAFLVMDDIGDFVTDFHLGEAPLQALGWAVERVPWRSAPEASGVGSTLVRDGWC